MVEAKIRGKKKLELKSSFSCSTQAVAKCTKSGNKSLRNMSNQATEMQPTCTESTVVLSSPNSHKPEIMP